MIVVMVMVMMIMLMMQLIKDYDDYDNDAINQRLDTYPQLFMSRK